MSPVRIIGTSKIQFPAGSTDYPPPGSTIPLSLFDVRWVPFQPMKTLLLYPAAAVSSSSFNSFVSSLALVLPHFHLLAGDLTYRPATDDVAILCTDDTGVTVIEAESKFDILSLASDPTHDIESFFQLVPNTFQDELPMPVLSVQFTKFTGGGVAVGIALHHMAMDAWGLMQFLDCWSKTCHDGVMPPGLTSPVHDRDVIVYPGKETIAREILDFRAPNRPKINPVASLSDLKKITRRVFNVDPATIQLLKQKSINDNTAETPSPPTTFQVLAVHTWTSIARARRITSANNKPTFLLCFIDGRTLLPSPMSLSYTGNCLFPCIVHSTGSALMSANGFGRTCTAIAETVRMNKSGVMTRTAQEQLTLNLASLTGLKVAIIGSNRLNWYDKDFGWGTPGLEALVSMNGDGDVVITAGKERGSVQITVGLKEDMDAFICAFEEGLASLVPEK